LGKDAATRRVLMVCTGNICRSPFAEAVLRRELEKLGMDEIEVGSAGTGTLPGLPPTDVALLVAAEIGYDLSGHRSRQISEHLVAQSDLILGMHVQHVDAVAFTDPKAVERTFLLPSFPEKPDPSVFVTDPIGEGEEVYRMRYAEIERIVKRITPEIVSYIKAHRGTE
jgi:protein-tyrosine phosphatase